MKSFLYTFILLFAFNFSYSQIVDIPDANFKNALIYNNAANFNDFIPGGSHADYFNSGTSVDLNNDGEIQVSEAELVKGLYLYYHNSWDLTGIEAFVNLEALNFADSPAIIDLSFYPDLEYFGTFAGDFTELDFSSNINLVELELDGNNIISLNLSNNINLEFIKLDYIYEPLAFIDLTNCPNLSELRFSLFNGMQNLDLSQNSNLNRLTLNVESADYINLKNGNTPENFNVNFTNVNYICADEIEVELLQQMMPNNPAINSYCLFTPGGDYYTIEGENRVDANTNGCDIGDNFYPNLKFNITDGTNSGTYIADNSGSYSIPVSEGTHTLSPIIENPDYFNVTPSSTTIIFPTDGNPYTQDFCITPNGVHNDIEVVIVPTTGAVPGFDSEYKIIYKNKGNTTLSGTINLDFDDDYMDFLSANPTEAIESTSNLQWNYSDLQPFETREIEVSFNLNTPTDPNFPLNSNDILEFDVDITPYLNDETPEDNEFGLNQTVVNSYDPNDKTCLEGITIRPENVGDFVHYVIRFENLGTANAVNVVVKDMIDTSKYDVSTLIPLDASHDFITRITNTNNVEFIFENIQLPFDDANNDGYVVFKIKTLETLQLGDTFENDAEIFFDFNAPIMTNIYSTAVQDNLSVTDFEFGKVRLYPNPTNDVLNISSAISLDNIKIFDINGRLVLNQTIDELMTENTISVKDLTSGVYFLEAKAGERTKVLKFIKQ